VTLHVVSGRSVAGTLAFAEIEGDVISWDDFLYDGPVPAGVGDRALRRVRARFLAEPAGPGRVAFVDILTYLAARDEAFAGADDILLWFDADLHCQLQLIQALARLEPSAQRARLLCIDSFPGYEGFVGLGQLRTDELLTLLGSEHAVTVEEQELGARAWDAFRSPDPDAINRLLASETSALPFLADALRRHLEEFPSIDDGLSRTERTILRLVAEEPSGWTRLYGPFLESEERPFMNDFTFSRRIEALMTAATPLIVGRTGGFLELRRRLQTDAHPEQKLWPAASGDELTLTAAGKAVLAGEADAVELNGIDRWFGGVHLTGKAPPWRWDDGEGSVIRVG
jgi:hypothetical protein